MKTTIAKRLTEADINTSLRLLDGWSGKLTWEKYLSVLAVELGHKYTKAAMLRHPRIKSAWNKAKDRLQSSEGGHGTIGMKQATDRIRVLQNRVERLEQENNKLLEQFLRWAKNASEKGLNIDDLDRPLPPARM